jgi:peptidoglycan/LPS O-acetylase OafA/YrhL
MSTVVLPDLAGTVHAPPRAPARSGFRRDIEGLRGLAVLLVVLFHVGVPGFSGGFVGVDVFFVLSGYLITTLLAAEVERTGRVDYLGFYARRIRRLLPASLLMLAVVVAVGAVVLSPLEQLLFARTARATALYGSNLWFTRALDYFGPNADANPLLHTWSLAVEEQFYLVWPIIVAVAARRSRRTLAVALLLLSAFSFAGSLWLTHLRPGYAFFLMPARAWEFGLGGLAALIPATLARRHAGAVLGWGGLAAVVLAAFAFSAATPFPGVAALLPVVGTAAALVAGCAAAPRVPRPLDHPVFQHLGRLSYSWYLWHWPALVFAAALVPGLSLPGRLLCAAGSLALAELTFRLVEDPVRRSPALLARRGRTLQLGLALTASGVAAASLWLVLAARAAGTPAQAALVAATTDRGRIYDGACVAGLSDAGVRECVFGDPASPRVVALVGDSHAAQWVAALEPIARARGWRLVTFIKSGCPAASVPVFNPRLRRVEPECERWRQEVARRLAARGADAVLVANWGAYVRGGAHETGYSTLTPEAWSGGLYRTFRSLGRSAGAVILLRDSPFPGFDVPVCLSRGGRCDFRRDAALNPALHRAEADAARRAGASIVDVSDRFCSGGVCRAREDGVVRFYDESHITATFAARLAAPLAAQLVPLVERRRGGSRGRP